MFPLFSCTAIRSCVRSWALQYQPNKQWLGSRRQSHSVSGQKKRVGCSISESARGSDTRCLVHHRRASHPAASRDEYPLSTRVSNTGAASAVVQPVRANGLGGHVCRSVSRRPVPLPPRQAHQASPRGSPGFPRITAALCWVLRYQTGRLGGEGRAAPPGRPGSQGSRFHTICLPAKPCQGVTRSYFCYFIPGDDIQSPRRDMCGARRG